MNENKLFLKYSKSKVIDLSSSSSSDDVSKLSSQSDENFEEIASNDEVSKKYKQIAKKRVAIDIDQLEF